MRTVKRDTSDLNKGKLEILDGICHAYAAEKRYWLDRFASVENQAKIKTHRKVRDEAVKSGYASPNGLQARMWKLALVEAAETWDKYWQALFIDVKAKIAANPTLDVAAELVAVEPVLPGAKKPKKAKKTKDADRHQRHYLYWILASYANFTAAMHGEIPIPDKFNPKNPARLVHYLQKIVKRARGKNPSVKKARSFALDADCYDVFEKNGVQYLKIMTLTKGTRLAIPMSGIAALSGNIRVVVDKDVVRIHKPQQTFAGNIPYQGDLADLDSNDITSLDIGYTEVAMDEQGTSYGKEFGSVLTAASDRRCSKGKSRNKLYALEKKHRANGDFTKADHIRTFNLGQVKQQKQTTQEQQHLANIVNQSLNEILRERKPKALVTEDLRHIFSFGKPKGLNRKLSGWIKGVVQDRTEFKVMAEGFRHEQVNPAYGSQTCPKCDFVDRKNRKDNKFKCRNPRCGYEGHSDQVAAINYKRRVFDPTITRYTPYREVKTTLMQRFNRRSEAEGFSLPDATAPGRTLEAVGLPISTGGLVAKTVTRSSLPRRYKRNRVGKQGDKVYSPLVVNLAA